MTVNA